MFCKRDHTIKTDGDLQVLEHLADGTTRWRTRDGQTGVTPPTPLPPRDVTARADGRRPLPLLTSDTAVPGCDDGAVTHNPVLGILYAAVMVAIVVAVDLLFFRDQPWLRLAVNVGIVLVFGAFYLRFAGRS